MSTTGKAVVMVPTYWHKVDCGICGPMNVALASSTRLIACPACGNVEAMCIPLGGGRSTLTMPWIKKLRTFQYGDENESCSR